MIKRLLVFALAFFVILFAVACAGAPAIAPAPPVVPTAPALAEDVLAIYHKSGGIAGIDETLTVYHGGVLELTNRQGTTKSLKINEPMVQPIRSLLEQKDFGELEPLYQVSGADLFVYTITARDSNGNTKSVTTMDGVKNPSYLGVLIGMLEQLREIVSKNG